MNTALSTSIVTYLGNNNGSKNTDSNRFFFLVTKNNYNIIKNKIKLKKNSYANDFYDILFIRI